METIASKFYKTNKLFNQNADSNPVRAHPENKDLILLQLKGWNSWQPKLFISFKI
jgi:hypothetical protein